MKQKWWDLEHSTTHMRIKFVFTVNHTQKSCHAVDMFVKQTILVIRTSMGTSNSCPKKRCRHANSDLQVF